LAKEEEKWVPPPRNAIKINWDASVDTVKKVIGMGYIARDDKGSFLAAVSKKEQMIVEPVVAETLAALNAILWCQEQNFQEVIFEGDALQVVKDVNTEEQCSSYYGHLVEDAKHGLRSLNGARFCHVRRSANAAAHELASIARNHVIDVIRWNFIPPSVSGIVQREGL
jgi:ribonuclease HI